jgi:CubicO group peptidase (beta-lactamase class C family)
LVARGPEVVYERYFGGREPEELHTSFSVAKSVLSVLVGAAIEEGHLSLDTPITDHLPELAVRDGRFADVTVDDLITMSSGLAYVERSLPWSDDARTYDATDLRTLALEGSRISAPPGAFHYNNYNPLLMGLILERATGEPVTTLLERYLWHPAGMEADASWSLDSERHGFEKLESGVSARPADFLRLGMLFRDGGQREGQQVIPRAWVHEATTPQVETADGWGYGYWWWLPPGEAEAPATALAWGNHGQFIYVAPDLDVVIVRVGRRYGVDPGTWPVLLEELATRFASSSGGQDADGTRRVP